MIRIVVAEDHAVVREGLKGLLNGQADFEVIDDTGDGRVVVDRVERLQPDVLVLDLMMPGLSGIEVTRRVRERSPATQVVILSMHAEEAYVLEALEAGARGYVLKASPSSELIRAIREATARRHYVGPPLSEHIIHAYLRKTERPSVDPYDRLTSREREILQLAAEGHTSTAIARQLFISPRTVETHRAHLMHKLGIHTQADLTRYAIQRGIISTEG